ncbi:MAG: sulfatase [Eubacteriales bacterium]|nr:sulfatase [Eubacteriales bacterium]
MKAIMIMFDSLNRRFLTPYNEEAFCEMKTPNFDRLAKHSVTFDNCYIGSMPCMPARRELHTGRYNMLHRSWGPLEPFDDSMPELLSKAGIYTHLITDHQHYWEDGGATYHHRYDSFELIRGQEGDRWKANVAEYRKNCSHINNRLMCNDAVNRTYMKTEEHQPQTQVFDLGLEFLEINHGEDQWFLQIESFDPHEPFYVTDQYKRLYPDAYGNRTCDWPPYAPVTEDALTCEHLRNQYKAILSMCDRNLGRVLDFMDSHDMWRDTLLIVNTDHGYLLGEHGWWAKMCMPHYNEIARIPLFIWNPICSIADEHRRSLVQGIDLPPTIMEFFHIAPTKDMLGRSVDSTLRNDEECHSAVLFGMHGQQLNVTDGRYVYMRAPVSKAALCYDYTQMPTHMRARFSVEEMRTAQLSAGFSFTKGCPVMKIQANRGLREDRLTEDSLGTLAARDERYDQINQNWLFDIENDPDELHPLHDPKTEAHMLELMRQLMKKNEAPQEMYQYYGI